MRALMTSGMPAASPAARAAATTAACSSAGHSPPAPSASSRLQPTAPASSALSIVDARVAEPALEIGRDRQLDRARDDPHRRDHRLARDRLAVREAVRGRDRPARGRDRPAAGRRGHDPRARGVPDVDQYQRLGRLVQPPELLRLLTLRAHTPEPFRRRRVDGALGELGDAAASRWRTRSRRRLEERVGGRAAGVGEPDLAARVDQARQQRQQRLAVALLVEHVGGQHEVPGRARDERLGLRPRAAQRLERQPVALRVAQRERDRVLAPSRWRARARRRRPRPATAAPSPQPSSSTRAPRSARTPTTRARASPDGHSSAQ